VLANPRNKKLDKEAFHDQHWKCLDAAQATFGRFNGRDLKGISQKGGNKFLRVRLNFGVNHSSKIPQTAAPHCRSRLAVPKFRFAGIFP